MQPSAAKTAKDHIITSMLVLVTLVVLVMGHTSMAQAQDARFIAGPYTMVPSSTGQSVSLQLTGVQDEQGAAGSRSGAIGFELWYLREPFYGTGGPGAGFKVASTYLPAGNCTNPYLDAGESCFGIPLQESLSLPPPGLYYPVLFLVERGGAGCGTQNGECYEDHVALTDEATGTGVVTVRAASGRLSDKGTGGAAGTGVLFTPGTESVSYNFTADTVDLSISGVENTNSYETGTLEVEAWFSSSPYDGSGTINGTKVASYRLPASCTIGNNQLAANSGCDAFDSGSIAASFPGPGTYYVILTLDEYNSNDPQCSDNDYFCFDDEVQLDSQVTVPAPVPLDFGAGGSGGGGSGGGGSLGWGSLMLLGVLIALEASRPNGYRRR